MPDIQTISEQLTRLVRAKTADAAATVTNIEPLPGHAGFGYSFVLERSRKKNGVTKSLCMIERPIECGRCEV